MLKLTEVDSSYNITKHEFHRRPCASVAADYVRTLPVCRLRGPKDRQRSSQNMTMTNLFRQDMTCRPRLIDSQWRYNHCKSWSRSASSVSNKASIDIDPLLQSTDQPWRAFGQQGKSPTTPPGLNIIRIKGTQSPRLPRFFRPSRLPRLWSKAASTGTHRE